MLFFSVSTEEAQGRGSEGAQELLFWAAFGGEVGLWPFRKHGKKKKGKERKGEERKREESSEFKLELGVMSWGRGQMYKSIET